MPKLTPSSPKVLVTFRRPFETGRITGYVIDAGPVFFLLALVDDNIRFNGFLCIRHKDVKKLQKPSEHAAFMENALRLRKERIPKLASFKLDSLPDLLSAANRSFPLITIHREQVDPGVCHIGRILGLDEKRVSLLEIGPDAEWDELPMTYQLREITRVDFGGGYEQALTLVGTPKFSRKD